MRLGQTDVAQAVSTGSLPAWGDVERHLGAAYRRCRQYRGGAVADYIPRLARADPEAFGASIAEVTGGAHVAGDADSPFSIQSISKVFVYALACSHVGHEAVSQRVGVNNTGLPFNSVIAVELNDGHPMNPMVNAGAIATTALVPGADPEERWAAIRGGLAGFAGHALGFDREVYESESATNGRNRAIAELLASYGRLDTDPRDAVDVYTRQCSVQVSARDLAVMGATLADGGTNPLTGERVVSPAACRDALAVMATSGLYERSGEWLFEIGVPGKSGVSGGIVAVAPGKGGIGVFSPRLDEAGNSVRGVRVAAYLSRALGLNVFASAVKPRTKGSHRG